MLDWSGACNGNPEIANNDSPAVDDLSVRDSVKTPFIFSFCAFGQQTRDLHVYQSRLIGTDDNPEIAPIIQSQKYGNTI